MGETLKANRVVHFPNLNGVRFLAAFVVLVHHVEQYRNIYGQTNYWSYPIIERLGEQGVTLFFVLSGFLITYLLLTEKTQFAKIATRQFYLRRVLRIWPLYFLVVLLSFLVLPYIHFFDIPGWTEGVFNNIGKKILLFAVVAPNVALSVYGIVPYLSQSWSIGTEEQFYLFWPWVVQKATNPLKVFLLMCVVYILFKYTIISVFNYNNGFNIALKLLHAFLYWFRIESMFIGSVFAALLFFKYEKILDIIISRAMQVVVFLLVVAIALWGHAFPLYSEVYSVLFGIIILNLAASSESLISLENRMFNFLGQISYGLYMLQTIAIVAAIKILALPMLKNIPNPVAHLLTIILSLAGVITLATFSYYGLEKPFLSLKKSFMLVKSKD